MMKIRDNSTQTLATIALTTKGPAIDCDRLTTLSAQCNVTVNTPSNPTFLGSNTSLVTGTITSTAHGLVQGLLVTLTTSGALPTGLATSTTYYVILLTANTFQLASSAANALAGTPIIPSGAGSGTNTVVVTALAGGTVQLEKSNDGINWVTDGNTVAVTATGSLWLEKQPQTTSKWMRISYALTSGSFKSSTVLCLIGLE